MKTDNKTLEKILREIRSLRREVALFVPHESSQDYTNQAEIKKALKNARQQVLK